MMLYQAKKIPKYGICFIVFSLILTLIFGIFAPFEILFLISLAFFIIGVIWYCASIAFETCTFPRPESKPLLDEIESETPEFIQFED